MAQLSDHDVDALVQRILTETDKSDPPTTALLRSRAAQLSPAAQSELLERLRGKNPPLLASTPSNPPPPGVLQRTRSAAGT